MGFASLSEEFPDLQPNTSAMSSPNMKLKPVRKFDVKTGRERQRDDDDRRTMITALPTDYLS
eukprot:scaffold468572_cov13-Prasinocladus_malaysianus.AAC.1